MSKKNATSEERKFHTTQHISVGSLFSGVSTIGDIFGSKLDELRAKHTPRVRLTRSYVDSQNCHADVAVVETTVRAPTNEAQAMNLRTWLRCRQLVSGILSGVNTLEGISMETAISMLTRAGVIGKSRQPSARKCPDGIHEHLLPTGAVKDALLWFAHSQRVDNGGVEGYKAPWDLVVEADEPSQVYDETAGGMIANPKAGEPMTVSRAYLETVIEAIKDLEAFEVKAGVKVGPLVFPKVAGPLLPLAALTPTPDGMERRHGVVKPMAKAVVTELPGYVSGTVYVMRIQLMEGRLTVNVACPYVYLGAGTRRNDGSMDYSNQKALQKGDGKKSFGGRWEPTWRALPPSRTIARDGEQIAVWQPFAKYEADGQRCGFLSEWLKRTALEADGAVGLSWLQPQGSNEVFLTHVRATKAGAKMLAEVKELMSDELAFRKEAASLARAAVTATSEVTTPAAKQQAQETLDKVEATAEQAAAFQAALEGSMESPEVVAEDGLEPAVNSSSSEEDLEPETAAVLSDEQSDGQPDDQPAETQEPMVATSSAVGE